jgi:hypothetical protein
MHPIYGPQPGSKCPVHMHPIYVPEQGPSLLFGKTNRTTASYWIMGSLDSVIKDNPIALWFFVCLQADAWVAWTLPL